MEEINIQVWLLSKGVVKRRTVSFNDIETLEEYYSRRLRFISVEIGYFEMVVGPQRLYMDIDRPDEAALAMSDFDWYDLLLRQCEYIHNHITRLHCYIQDPVIVVTDQSTAYKKSAHIIVANYYAEDNIICKRFYEECDKIDGVDGNVYHSQQAFRMLGSYKADRRSTEKKVAFVVCGADVSPGENVGLRDTLLGWTAGCFLYTNDNEGLDKKRTVEPYWSNGKNEKLLLDRNRLG